MYTSIEICSIIIINNNNKSPNQQTCEDKNLKLKKYYNGFKQKNQNWTENGQNNKN